MTKSVCKRLLKAPEIPIKSDAISKDPGIYAIKEKESRNRPDRILYVGKSINPKRRIKQHLRGKKQSIDKKIHRIAKARLFVQQESVDEPGRNEKKFIDCLKEMGEKLPYNKTGGNSRSKKSRKRK